ncbi:MAG TPA: OmpH family outer membrane protein [Gammaproteobacteria bacterium]|nr:OmpH family outer membrane protein [Gammaproteobacteria bacterium]
MKSSKNISLLAGICLALVSGLAYADLRVGLVDKQVLGQESLYAKSVHEKMKKEFAARQEALITREKDLMSKYEALERDKDVIAEADRGKKERDLAKLKQSLQEDSEAFQHDVMQRQEKEGAAFEKVVAEVLAEIAKEEKLDLVLQQQVALFTNRKADYTYKALQSLDKRYKETKK